MKGPLLAVGLPVVALGAAKTCGAQQPWDNIPLLNIYQLAYPVEWNGKTIVLGARLQVPAEAHDKMPAVIMMHGTGGIRYSGVYYAAALNGAGIATLEVDQWGGRGLPGGASSRPARKGYIPVRPELVAEVKFFGRYHRGWIRDGVLLSVG